METVNIGQIPRDRLEKALAVRDFMLGPARHIANPNITLTELASLLRQAGVPLDRAATIVGVLHAEMRAVARIWERGQPARDFAFPNTGESGDYWNSPAKTAHETGDWVILWLPETPDDAYDIIPQLKADGYTHFICAPVFLANEMANAFTFATRSPDGFSDDDILILRSVFPAIAACQEILVMHRILKEVVRMYVGNEPHKRILAGDVRRGEVSRIESAILFVDMRGFTRLTSSMDAEDVTALINDYYDCVVPHVEEAGGEVLKFIGDGVLAIFRAASSSGQRACASAIDTSEKILAAVDGRNGRAETECPFDVGIGLHYGQAAYGNVGSGARLDYTVIGRDVNLASRISGLCGNLNIPLLISSETKSRISDRTFRSIGRYELKGIDRPVEIFCI